MSMKCEPCCCQVTTAEFVGYLTAEMLLIFKMHLRRSFFYVASVSATSSNWNQSMAGFANDFKLPCVICQKHAGWVAEGVDLEKV